MLFRESMKAVAAVLVPCAIALVVFLCLLPCIK